MHATRIIGYVFAADIICPSCLRKKAAIINEANGHNAEFTPLDDLLNRWAKIEGIEDREDEDTFDSDDFPKVVFESGDAKDETCGTCGERLDGDLILHLPTSWTDEVLDDGFLRWIDVNPRPACGSTVGESIAEPDDGDKVNCPQCKPYVWTCGCVAHHTKPGGMGVYCITEQNGYCNFECPHDEEAYEERKAELIASGVPESEAITQAEREVNEAREASIAARREGE